jgi:TPR repeat protein
MTAKRLIWTALVLIVGTMLPLHAQQSTADHRQLDEIKTRADKGDADALIALAGRYSLGDGVPRDLAKAAKLHRKAAELGDARGECLLGYDYADGLGVKKNLTEAVHWLRKAADQGLADAQFDLAVCYGNGEIEGRSIVDAAELYRKAADQGMPQAEAALGNCYLEGMGVPKSIPEGIKWIRKAAEQGFAGAQQILGMCYAKGKGVTTNNVEAYKWLALAAAKENQSADDIKVNISMVERFMTPEQIAEGQRLAAEFVPGAAKSHSPEQAGKPAAPNAAPASHDQARTGLVNVKADDAAQEIFVDSAFVGNTPAKLKLAEGPHVIEVKKAGFKDYWKQIQVGDGAELTLNVVLEKR